MMKKSQQDWNKQEAERKKKQDEENAKVSPEMRKIFIAILPSIAYPRMSEKV